MVQKNHDEPSEFSEGFNDILNRVRRLRPGALVQMRASGPGTEEGGESITDDDNVFNDRFTDNGSFLDIFADSDPKP